MNNTENDQFDQPIKTPNKQIIEGIQRFREIFVKRGWKKFFYPIL